MNFQKSQPSLIKNYLVNPCNVITTAFNAGSSFRAYNVTQKNCTKKCKGAKLFRRKGGVPIIRRGRDCNIASDKYGPQAQKLALGDGYFARPASSIVR